jgi:hypothetical protein
MSVLLEAKEKSRFGSNPSSAPFRAMRLFGCLPGVKPGLSPYVPSGENEAIDGAPLSASSRGGGKATLHGKGLPNGLIGRMVSFCVSRSSK